MTTFNMEHFRQIPTVPEMMKYLKETTKKLGMGAARDAWDTGLGYCIKTGPDATARIQNKHEARVYSKSHSHLLPEVYECAPNFQWISVETVRPLKSEAEVNAEIVTSTDWAIQDLAELHKKVREAKEPSGNQWFDDLVQLVRSTGLKIDELHKGNWGVNREGVLVILDTGK